MGLSPTNDLRHSTQAPEKLRTRSIRVWGLAVILLLGQHAVIGQTSTGTINGTITDPAGAAIPNANVTVISVQTGIQQKTQSNASGNYIFPALAVGDYTITVDAQGFGTTTES